MMETKDTDKVLAFDTLYTNNRIQMMKVMFPYLEPSMQKKMAVYIKFMELQYTIEFFKKKESEVNICSQEVRETDTTALMLDMQRYCSKEQREKINQMINMQNTMKMYQEMQGMMEMFGAFSNNDPENPDSDGGGNSPDMSEMLKNMLSPEQQAMFDMFNQSM